MSTGLILSAADEFFTHQIALPHQVVQSSDPGWRERYWISVFDTVARDRVLSFGFGKYPNRDVMDAFAILADGREQRNLRAARRLSPAFATIGAGPLSAEIVTPLTALRFLATDNAAGFAFDLLWEGAVSPALEGRHFEVNRGRVTHELVRYVQTGQVSGTIRIDDERIEVTPDRWWGVRDHSWGIRPMSAAPGDPPAASVPWNFLAFCPIRFPAFSVHIYLFEAQPGRPTHLSAAILRPPGEAPRDDEIRSVEHDLRWRAGAPVRTLEGGTLTIDFFDGRRLEIAIAACPGRAFLAGGGYGTFQGKWWGDAHVEHDRFDLADAGRLRSYNSHASDHLIEARCDGAVGFGIIEYLVRRGYGRDPATPAGQAA